MDQELYQNSDEILTGVDCSFAKHDLKEIIDSVKESEYFDASSMAPLSLASVAAIARLRSYKPPPFSAWDRLPLSRRAAVLVLLFADRRGDLRVVLTMRAASLRNYSGQAAFPGGKADTLEETPFEIARREASEEIGFPNNDAKILKPFRIEHLCQLPFYLAKTALAVRPCVAFLHSSSDDSSDESSVEESMMPSLDAKEVAAVFSAPFHNFLKQEDEVQGPGEGSDWYKGEWIKFHDTMWAMHNFFVPIDGQKVSKPKGAEGGQEKTVEKLEEVEKGTGRYKVWGMTARMLVDAAQLAYDEVPEFEHNEHLGDETMIENLERNGRLKEKLPGGPDLTDADLKHARDGAIKADISKI